MFLSSMKALLVFFAGLTIPSHAQTVVDIISHEMRFSTFVTMLTAARLTHTLNGDGPFTLFAPTNEAFIVSRVNATRLLQPIWSAHLTDLLTFHITLSEISSNSLAVGDTIDTAQGDEVLTVTTNSGDLFVLNYNATVMEKDKDASNGVVNVMDHVLLPISASLTIYQYAKANSEYSILAFLIEKADLVDALNGPGPRSIFAPTDAAFSPLQGTVTWDDFVNDQTKVRNLLLYHLLDGNVFSDELITLDSIQSVQGSDIDIDIKIFFEGGDEYAIVLNDESDVTMTDSLVKSGLFHTIDRVLTPPDTVGPTIADLLKSHGHTVFENAARRTGLWDILNNPSETLTCFGTIDAGFDPAFTTILNNYDYYLHLEAAMNHQMVGNQALETSELMPNMEMPTLLEGESLTVTQGHPNRPIIINLDSTIQISDLIASNGALQVIDRVIVPQFLELNVVDVIARQPLEHSTLLYLLVLTGLIPDLSSDGPYTVFAPTNSAFQQLLSNSGDLVGTDWTSNIDTIREILKYHIVPEVLYEEQLAHNSTHITLQGDTILASNTAYAPLGPLTPQPTTATPETAPASIGPSARRLPISESLDIPASEFPYVRRSKLLHRRLSHMPGNSQILPGEVLLNGRAGLVKADQFAYNGVVHSIDTLLIPGYKPNTVDEAADQICLQWGQFENLCCPLEPGTTEVSKQGNSDWYCDYIVFP